MVCCDSVESECLLERKSSIVALDNIAPISIPPLCCWTNRILLTPLQMYVLEIVVHDGQHK